MENEKLNNSVFKGFEREWLETDGMGGYASSTHALCNTRKYHGLYVSPVEGLEGRYLFLSGIEPLIEHENAGYEFSNSQYPGKINPEGYKYLKSFKDYPFPEWIYENGKCLLLLEMFMTEENGLIIRMKNNSHTPETLKIKLNLLFSLRNSHHLAHQNNDAVISMVSSGKMNYAFSCYPTLPPVHISFSSDMDYRNSPCWIKDTEYLRELDRGFDFREDRIMPGTFFSDFKKGDEVFIRISLRPFNPETEGSFGEIYLVEKKRRQQIRKKYSSEKNTSLRILKEKSHHFLIKNSSGDSSIIAGYPWFGEWGRDTMISLPGLTFYNSCISEGIEILRSYTRLIKNGLLPNTLSGTQGFESYNSVDASLLYIYAVQQLFRNVKSGKKAAAEFHSSVGGILEAFLSGRVPNASADENGLLSAGDENTQLTWMDAMVNNVPVTPRSGSPVDINALWYNGLRFFIEQSKYMKIDISEKYYFTAEKIRSIFKDKYWIEEGGYTADTVNSSGRDRSVRPNMLWAVSLPWSPLGLEECRSIVGVCREKLLTSSGLRTLSPDNPAYEGQYTGGGNERDSKYHQGTVWPWLFGIYTEASLRVSDNPEKTADEIKLQLDSFLDHHLSENGSGFISEVFDGTDPESGKGSFAQAWSSGEIIRSYALIDRVKRGMKI